MYSYFSLKSTIFIEKEQYRAISKSSMQNCLSVKCKPICHVAQPIERSSAEKKNLGCCFGSSVRIPLHFLQQIREESQNRFSTCRIQYDITGLFCFEKDLTVVITNFFRQGVVAVDRRHCQTTEHCDAGCWRISRLTCGSDSKLYNNGCQMHRKNCG